MITDADDAPFALLDAWKSALLTDIVLLGYAAPSRTLLDFRLQRYDIFLQFGPVWIRCLAPASEGALHLTVVPEPVFKVELAEDETGGSRLCSIC